MNGTILFGGGSDKRLDIEAGNFCTRDDVRHTIITFFTRSEWGKYGDIYIKDIRLVSSNSNS